MASTKLMDYHFWTHTIGVVLYTVSMWISGIGQGLMSRATNEDGTLTYAFVEILKFTYPYYFIRFCGGLLVIIGMVLMMINMIKTFRMAKTPYANPVLIPPTEIPHA